MESVTHFFIKDLDLRVRRPRFSGSKKIEKDFATPEDRQNEVRNSLRSTYFKAIVSQDSAQAYTARA